MPNITEEEYATIMAGNQPDRFVEMTSADYRRIMGLNHGAEQIIVSSIPKSDEDERKILQRAMRLWIETDKSLCPYVEEHMFHDTREWRFDFAWPEEKVAIEIQGGIYSGGQHVRGKGYENDSHKLNEAQLHGWIELYVTAKQIRDGSAIRYLKRALDIRRGGEVS